MWPFPQSTRRASLSSLPPGEEDGGGDAHAGDAVSSAKPNLHPNTVMPAKAGTHVTHNALADSHAGPDLRRDDVPLRRWRPAQRFASAASIAMLVVGYAGFVIYRHATADMAPLALERANETSVTVLDRNGQLLRAFTTADGRWRLPLDPEDVDQRYLAMLMAFEDRRFYQHPGVDARAIARAAAQFAVNGRIISGASTLTMQTARLLEGKHERTGAGKLRQIARALELERKLDKRGILKIYLRLAPFGGNIEGVRAASLAYFGKEPRRLSVGEAALLVALPQSPEIRRPDRNAKAAERARNRVLDIAVENGVITEAEARRARDEAVPTARREFPKLAAHLAESELAREATRNVHRLTIDRRLQKSLEDIAAQHVAILGQKLSAAVLVADNQTGEILAHVGSANYLDPGRQGAIDMVTAVRSPGSTLKPLIYGLGFEAGLAHPETLIDDRPVRFGNYAPKNFDDEFHGTVSVREALAQSLNVPAVRMLAKVGPQRLSARLNRAGISADFPGDEGPSLAMALGGVGMTLRDVTKAYVGLARGGDAVVLSHTLGESVRLRAAAQRPGAKSTRLLSPIAAWYVTDILKGAPPPINAKGGTLAYKTGTSYGYRDAWAIGYDGRHTIGVWVGRADGASVPGLMGRTAAAPLLFDAFQRISEKRAPLLSAPRGAITATNADLPPPLKRWREPGDDTGVAAKAFAEPPVVISFPLDRSEMAADELAGDAVTVKAAGGALPLTWLVDDAPVTSDPHKREINWAPQGRGFTKFTVIDAHGRVDRVSIRIN